MIKCDCLKVVEKRLRLQYNLGSGVFTIFSREVGWIDGWNVGWMDGWLERWTDGWMDGWKKEANQWMIVQQIV